MTMAEPEKIDPSIKREYLWSAIGFTVAAPLYCWFALSRLADTWLLFWVGVVGAVCFTVMALLAWISFFRNWSVEKSDDVALKMFGWLVASPFLAAGLVALLVAVFAMGRWLLGIPSWAGVIIFLLIAVLFQMRRR